MRPLAVVKWWVMRDCLMAASSGGGRVRFLWEGREGGVVEGTEGVASALMRLDDRRVDDIVVGERGRWGRGEEVRKTREAGERDDDVEGGGQSSSVAVSLRVAYPPIHLSTVHQKVDR